MKKYMKGVLSLVVACCMILSNTALAALNDLLDDGAAAASADWTDPAKLGDYILGVTVPDTLDLAERGALAVQGLTAKAAQPGGVTGDDLANVLDAIVKGRNMSGSNVNLAGDTAIITALTGYLKASPNTKALSEGMLALQGLYNLYPTSAVEAILNGINDALLTGSVNTAGNASYTARGFQGYSEAVSVNGAALRAVSSWAGFDGAAGLKTANVTKYRNAILTKAYWEAEARPRVVVDAELARFNGNMGAYASALLGLLTYAEYSGDTSLLNYVQSGYKFIREYGLKSIGLFGEICVTAEMTRLALKLSLMGVGDYWDDAERYIRNELAEKQVTSGSDTGLFYSASGWPTHLTAQNDEVGIRCSAAAAQAMYDAWESIVTGDKDMAQVNLLLNRSSCLLDVHSYLPYTGRVELAVKDAKAVSVRLPLWVDWKTVSVAGAGYGRVGHYLILTNLSPGANISITFDLAERTEPQILKWKESDPFYNSTLPGASWIPADPKNKFDFTFKGYTLVEIRQTAGVTATPTNILLYQGRGGSLPSPKTVDRYIPYHTVSERPVKDDYPGAPLTVSDVVPAGQTTAGKTLALPALPDGATYPASGTVGGTGLIASHSIAGTTLTYGTTSQSDGTTDTLTITVSNATHYKPYDVVVTVTAVPLEPQTITFGTTPAAATYGDVFTHTAALQGAGGTGAITYAVTSGPAAVDVNTGEVTVTGVGLVTITATKASDATYAETTAVYSFMAGSKTLTVTGLTAADRPYDGTTAVGVTGGALDGVVSLLDDVDYTPAISGGDIADANAGNNKSVTVAAISLTGADAGKYTLTQPTGITVNITPKDIVIDTVAAPTKDWDGTAAASAGAVTFSGEITGQALTAGTDYTVSVVFTDGSYDAGTGNRLYTYTVTMLNTTKANNYNLTPHTKTGTDGTINKISYPGAPLAVSDSVRADEAAAGKTVVLPGLPAGAGYTTVAVGGSSGLIDGTPTVSGTTLTYSTTSQSDGTTDTITIGVTGATNYDDYSVVVTVTAQTVQQEDVPAATIDYMNEQLTGLTANAAYTVNGTAKSANASGKILIDAAWLGQGVSIVKTGVAAAGTADSDPQYFTIPARPNAPAPGKTDTAGGGNNGSITGVDGTMEYRSGSSAWTAIAGTSVTGLAAGTYSVRVKATATAFAGVSASVSIAPSSGDSGYTPPPQGGGTPPVTNLPTVPVNGGAVQVNYAQSGGTVTLTLTDSKVEEIIEKAKDGEAVLDLTGVKGAETAVLDVNAAKVFSEAEVAVTVKLPGADVTLVPKTLAKLAATTDNGKTPVTVEANTVPVTDLNRMQAAQVRGYEPVVNVDVYVGSKKIDVPITTSLPYKLKTVENPKAVCVWYLNDMGNIKKLYGAYDEKTEMITFTVDHQGYFVVGYDPVALWENRFTDVSEDHPFYDAIAYASYYSGKLFAGTSDTTFDPDGVMTRGDFMTVLYKLAGRPAYSEGYRNFGDVKAGDYYYDAILWGANTGIVAGKGGDRFAPSDALSRQEMAVILYKYAAKVAGYVIPEYRGAQTFDKVDGWAATQTGALGKAGMLTSGGSDLTESASRAEIARVFMDFIRFVVASTSDR
ncbi:MAG: YDG domain-containing protein [Oscillospiraceae bacterium]|nr:YDG domain-containing protein [Oscillospiraceae bacterium]